MLDFRQTETTQDVRELTQRWFEEVWNQKRLETVDELLASTAESHGFPEPDAVQDAAAFRAAVIQMHEVFSSIRLTMEDVFVDGNRSAVRWSGSFQTANELDDEPLKLSGFATAEWSDGQIVKAWNFVDLASLKNRMERAAGSSEASAFRH